MNNDEAMTVLVAQKRSITNAIDGLDRYRKEFGDWKAAVKTSRIAAIKTEATAAGVDLSTWNGTAPA